MNIITFMFIFWKSSKHMAARVLEVENSEYFNIGYNSFFFCEMHSKDPKLNKKETERYT